MLHRSLPAAAVPIIGLAFLISSAFSAAPCAQMKMTVTPATITRGAMATATGSIKNCSGQPETLSVKYSATGPCDFNVTGTRAITLAAGETQSTSIPVMVPAVACPGAYTLTATAFAGKTRVASASIKVTVQ